MLISDDRRLSEIQAEFNRQFPYLQLAFYATPHHQGEGTFQKEQLDPSKNIGEVRTVHHEENISINGHVHAGNLEELFSERYGLNVQVLRKKNNVWLQTITTDQLSLSQLNREAELFHNRTFEPDNESNV
jgi:hypothetical protein